MPHLPAQDIDILLDNQISLFGQLYPLLGTVRRKSVTPFPPKTTIGDYTREDKTVESEWVISSLAGGLGITYARPNQDDDRYEIGDGVEARYRFLTLGPEVVTSTTVSGGGLTERLLIYNGVAYAVKGSAVYKCSSTTWTRLQTGSPAVDLTLAGTFRDACVYDGKLYLQTSTTLYAYDVTQAPGAAGELLTYAVGGYALAAYDDKLWRLDGSNAMSWAIHTGSAPVTLSAWTAGGRLLLPAGTCQQLVVFFDQTGLPALHAVTQGGVFGYDPDSQRFIPTPLQHPTLAAAGRGAAEWQGALWVPAGSTIYRYTGSVVQAAGPDRDDGLPAHLQGDITQLIPGHGMLYALGTASPGSSASQPLETGTGNATGDAFFPSSPSTGALFVSSGAAWHMLISHGSLAALRGAVVGTVGSAFRLWYAADGADSTTFYYLDLPTGLHNPLSNPARRYRASGYIDTPWQDMRWAELDKIALSLDVEAAQMSATETATLYVAYDEGTWERVGVVADSGQTRFALGGDEGRRFRTLRLRVELARGSDATKTPILKSLALGYMKVPPQLEGWEIALDLTDPRCTEEVGVPAGDLVEALFAAKAEKKAGLFAYRMYRSTPQTRRVWLHEVVGAERTGLNIQGRYNVLLVELDR